MILVSLPKKETQSPAILTWIVSYAGHRRPVVDIKTVPHKNIETTKTSKKIHGKNDLLLNITTKCTTKTKTIVLLNVFLAPHKPIFNHVTILPSGNLALSGI